jgi:hypothetical protein
MDTAVSVELFVEILNRYIYYFDQQNETVRAETTNSRRDFVLIECLSGHNKILERAHRAHTLQPVDKPRRQYCLT